MKNHIGTFIKLFSNLMKIFQFFEISIIFLNSFLSAVTRFNQSKPHRQIFYNQNLEVKSLQYQG